MFKKLLLFASVVLMIAMVSCKGDDGAVGPAGAAGAQGPAGAAGPKVIKEMTEPVARHWYFRLAKSIQTVQEVLLQVLITLTPSRIVL